MPTTECDNLPQDATARDIAGEQAAQAGQMQAAQQQLRELLARVHAQVPEVSEAEADRDIARAIREVRAKK